MNRRTALGLLAGALGLAGGKAADNALLGYGVLVGTNLREQDLSALVAEDLEPAPFETTVGDARVEFDGEALRVADGTRERRLDLAATAAERAVEVDAEFGLPGGPLEQLAVDLPAIPDEATFEFAGYEAFFDRLDGANARPFTVEALRSRRWTGVEPGTIERFTGASPTDPRAVVEGLADAFREHTAYDVPRYLAGSVEDNVLFGAVDLREHFASPTSFEAIERGETSGLFCWEYTYRSIEALQAAPAHRQSVPTFGCEVYDRRHGHVFTAIGSAVREDEELLVPMTFLDYSRSTWYDDFHLRWLLGDGLDAYGNRRRATAVIRR